MLIFLSLISVPVWAKPLVLISYFDAFNRAPFNNSERIAVELKARFDRETSPIQLELCALNTVFDRAFNQTEECLRALPQRPLFVLGLGESTCELKIETMMRNKDKTVGPDNAGTHRNNTLILPGAPSAIGLRFPLPQMYCALSESDRRSVDISNNAGTFVCNNTAYQMAHAYPELNYGFIHVPSNNCTQLTKKNELALKQLEVMMIAAAKALSEKDAEVLPISKAEIRAKRESFRGSCEGDFFDRMRSADERRFFLNATMN